MRSKGGGQVLAAVALVLCMLAVPAAAASPSDGSGTSGLERGARLLEGSGATAGETGAPGEAPAGGLSWSGPGFGFTDVHCLADPAGDTFVLDGDERVPFAEPRADIRTACADYDQTLELRLRVDDPTDPATWTGETGAFWYLDIDGDGGYDRAVAVEAGPDGPRAVVAEHIGDRRYRPLEGCDVDVAFDAGTGTLVAGGLRPGDCLDDSPRVVVGAVKVFETPAGQLVHDTTGDLATGRTGAPTLRPSRRLAGGDRFSTAAAISRERFGPGRQPPAAAYLARADGFADALAAGSLDASPATSGPILLVPACDEVPGVVLDELARVAPPQVLALGGEAAVCDDVLAQVAQAGEGRWDTARLAGGPAEPTRWGTAVAISQHAYEVPGVEDVYLATGEDFPDALAAGALDAGPLLLVPACEPLPEVVRGEIARLEPGRVVALGGTAAVCDGVVAEAVEAVRAAGGGEPLTERLSGPTRLDTAAEVSAYAFPNGSDAARAYVARADDFPDALAGAMLQGGPILLVPRCGDLPPAAARELRRLDPGEVVALGGTQAVCDQTLRHAANA